MESQTVTRFFLGANSPGGFASLYDGFTGPEEHLYILKGGPGCGKSTLMKRIGEACREAGHSVELIHCSGDPESLDGVRIPALGAAYVDGTSPHVIEPRFAGAQASYVNLGAFYDLDALRRDREAIEALTAAYKGHYARAFKLLRGAASLEAPPLPREAVEAADRRAQGLIRRELRRRPGDSGAARKRFLSAWTCLGHVTFFDTVKALADRVVLLDNDLGLARPVLEAAVAAVRDRGLSAILCQDPLEPEATEHLILPDLGLALVTQTARNPYPGPSWRHMRLDAIPDLAPEDRTLRRRIGKLRESVLTEATQALRDAKAAHDELESHYIPAVDFAGLDRLAERHIAALLG